MNKNVNEIPVKDHEEITTDISKMSANEIRMHLARTEAKERKKREQEQQKYIEERDDRIELLLNDGLHIHNLLSEYKKIVAETMIKQADELENYGKIPKKSKGGFSITNSKGTMRVVRRRDTEPTWDERGDKGVAMLKDFLGDVVKKRDVKMYEILMGFLVRNKNGDLEYSRVMDLLSHEDKYTDERWVEGLHLVKESYSNVMKGYGYQLLHRPKEGDKWESISLSFSSI